MQWNIENIVIIIKYLQISALSTSSRVDITLNKLICLQSSAIELLILLSFCKFYASLRIHIW